VKKERKEKQNEKPQSRVAYATHHPSRPLEGHCCDANKPQIGCDIKSSVPKRI